MPTQQANKKARPESFDAVQLEVYRHLFTALAEEMGAALRSAAYSPNIKERRDYSCALFSPEGDPVAQGDHMPVHLGAMPMSVAAALERCGPLRPGDVVILNDPWAGGTHLPDLTLVASVFDDIGVLLGTVAARAHHSDVGGMSPGSMPLAREIIQEGLRIPPMLLMREGERVGEVWELILANVRTPQEREGDLASQLAALHIGGTRLRELAERRGSATVLGAMRALLEYGDRLLREGIRRIPKGSWTAEDALDGDGFDPNPIPIRVTLQVEEEEVHVDFTGSGAQAGGGVNAVAAVTTSAARYVLRCVVEELLQSPLPAGGGAMNALRLTLPEGTVVNALHPSPVAAGNVETSQRVTDVLLRAFGKALPELIPALSQGTMNNTTMGGTDPRTGTPFTYYETVGGGMGGGPERPGLTGVHTHMSNTLNTPVEALEHAYPFRVLRYSIRTGSGGDGRHPGGEGLRRDLQLLAPATVTLLTERRSEGPSGTCGGLDGAAGENALIRSGEEMILPGKVTFEALPGDVVSIRSPGGGGWGSPPPLGDSNST